ncbi:putative basic amino acid antiporter YfcC [Alkaliphilus serpentinus]|uniref:Putative basic amino acid antiporter YfcC n=2 Tax=Alkaliphilus serpentinus TaxID=1482731 RepID=A0A833MAL2_9FIRM|nr:putative basic amino acid antiporter YfcC [Alkaliphilus serpentinus]
MPDTYVIIFFIVLLAALITYIIPLGYFEMNYKIVDEAGEAIAVDAEGGFAAGGETFKLDGNVVYDSEGTEIVSIDKAVEYQDENGNFLFKGVKEFGDYVPEVDENGEKITKGIKVFEKWGGTGFLNYVFEGMVSGSKWGSAVGVVAFILIIGGSFGIVLKTGAVEEGILSLISKTKGYEIAIIPIMFFLFSLGGAVFGMGEEAIAFAMILVPLVVALGYDAITGIMITYVATQIGFATSWMNPFSVAIAQGVAGVPVGSGAGFRIFMWVFFTLIGTVFTWIYATRIKKDPSKSLSYESDQYFRDDMKEVEDVRTQFGLGHSLVLLTVLLGVVWILYGVWKYEYYLPEIATVFFTMGLVAGIIGVIFKLRGMTVNSIAEAFRGGAADLVGAAMVVGMAKGIILVLGGSDPTSGTVLNTILYAMGNTIGGLGSTISAWIMYVFQSVFNFFVVSGSGQAALTMPLMAPLADLVGVSRQVAVLAFQLGDGLTNIIVPTSASLMGVLGVARLDWMKWAKFQIKFQGVLFVIASIFVLGAMMIGF